MLEDILDDVYGAETRYLEALSTEIDERSAFDATLREQVGQQN